jgi:hypothetical protein
MLVRLLITGQHKINRLNVRTITLGPDLVIEDEQLGGDRNFVRVDSNRNFSAIHMASQGYWQIQDDVDRKL